MNQVLLSKLLVGYDVKTTTTPRFGLAARAGIAGVVAGALRRHEPVMTSADLAEVAGRLLDGEQT